MKKSMEATKVLEWKGDKGVTYSLVKTKSGFILYKDDQHVLDQWHGYLDEVTEIDILRTLCHHLTSPTKED